MAEFKKKTKDTFWHSPLFLGVLFCVLILFTFNIMGLLAKERETSKKRDLELDKIESLRQREQYLNENIARLETEEGIEETIREKYQVVKEGEKEVIIVDEEEQKVELVNESKEHGFWGFIKRMFGK